MFCVEFNPPDDGQLGWNVLQTEHTHSYGLRIVSQLRMHGGRATGWTVGGFESQQGIESFSFPKTSRQAL